jgi:hypothetical protein
MPKMACGGFHGGFATRHSAPAALRTCRIIGAVAPSARGSALASSSNRVLLLPGWS